MEKHIYNSLMINTKLCCCWKKKFVKTWCVLIVVLSLTKINLKFLISINEIYLHICKYFSKLLNFIWISIWKYVVCIVENMNFHLKSNIQLKFITKNYILWMLLRKYQKIFNFYLIFKFLILVRFWKWVKIKVLILNIKYSYKISS